METTGIQNTYDKLYQDVTKALKERYPDGIEIYADYRDELMDDDIKRIAKSKNPRETFEELIFECYDETQYDYALEISDELKREFVPQYGEKMIDDKLSDTVQEVICNEIGYIYPLDHFYKQEICIDISIDNGDANYDFTKHIVGPHYDNYNGYNDTLDKESGLAWLVQQQGYTLTNFNKKFSAMCHGKECDDKFVRDIYNEIYNITSDCSYLVFCTKMTVGEYITALENKEPVTLSKETNCGLYNDWNGAGSVMEIGLTKDVTIPQDKIHRFIPDAALDLYDLDRKSHYNFSIRNTYGMSDAFWKNTYIPNPPTRTNTRARLPGQGLKPKTQSRSRDNSLQM